MSNFDSDDATPGFVEEIAPLIENLLMVVADRRPHQDYVEAMAAINARAENAFQVYLAASGMVEYGRSLADQAHAATCRCGGAGHLEVQLAPTFDVDKASPLQRAVYRFVLAHWHDDGDSEEAVFCTVPTNELPVFFTGLAIYVGRDVDHSLCLLDPTRHGRAPRPGEGR